MEDQRRFLGHLLSLLTDVVQLKLTDMTHDAVTHMAPELLERGQMSKVRTI